MSIGGPTGVHGLTVARQATGHRRPEARSGRPKPPRRSPTVGARVIGGPRLPTPVPRYRRGPKLAVDAVWILRGSLLLVRRGRPPFEGSWALPGGYVEPDESVETAVQREVQEETGLRARPVALIGVYSKPGRDPRGPNASVAFRMRGRGGPPSGGDDAADARWWPLDHLPPLAFDHAQIVRAAVRGTRSPSRTGTKLVRTPAGGPGGFRRRRPRARSGR
ncbi:MAG: NUDIX hydrolase [Thermoplasmata archaeon]|nr:NUDIX hydrolase [Thermoplasmata archaeon]